MNADDYEGALEIERAWREGLRPDPRLTVSEWAERYRMLSTKESAEPGRWLALMTGFLPDAAAFASWHYRRDPTHVVFYCEATFRHLAGQFGWHAAFPDANVVLMKKPGMKCNAGETQEAQ